MKIDNYLSRRSNSCFNSQLIFISLEEHVVTRCVYHLVPMVYVPWEKRQEWTRNGWPTYSVLKKLSEPFFSTLDYRVVICCPCWLLSIASLDLGIWRSSERTSNRQFLKTRERDYLSWNSAEQLKKLFTLTLIIRPTGGLVMICDACRNIKTRQLLT